jgi:hypothetical protein
VELQREVSGATSLKTLPIWPQLTWSNWKTPTGAIWSLGHAKPVREGAPAKVELVPLNWNSRVVVYGLP